MRWMKTALMTALAAALVAYILVERSRQREQQKVEERALSLFDGFKLEDLTGATLVNASETIILSKVSEAYWQMLQPVRSDGDKNLIETALRAIVDLKRDRVLGADPGDLADFGLAPPQLRIVLASETQGESDTLYIGDRNPTQSLAYAKFISDPEVFTIKASVLTSVEKNSFDFRDKRILTFEKDDVRKLNLRRGEELLVLTQATDGWEMVEPVAAKADDVEVDRLLNKVRFARATDFVAETSDSLAKWGLEKPEIALTLWLGEGMARNRLLLGNREGDKYYALDDSKPPVFLVRSDIYGELTKDLFKFRDRSLASFEREAVDRIELAHADTTIVCEKDTTGGGDGWSIVLPERRLAKTWRVSSIISQLKSLRAEQFVTDPDNSLATYGLDAPRARAKLYSGGEPLVEITLGDAVGTTDSLYAASTQRPGISIVKRSIFDDLDVGLDELAAEEDSGTGS